MTTSVIRVFFALAILGAVPGGGWAQSPAPVRYGKWALLAGAVGLNLAAASAHNAAERAFGDIEQLCAADRTRCDVDIEGRYVDPSTEALYQQTLRHDRRSRAYLFGGEAAVLGAAALFIWEFARPKSPPGNIPFEPQLSVHDGVTRLGIRVAW